MIFALLGDIRIGDAVWTGPTSVKEARKATLVEHKVAHGKPIVEDKGDELDTKSLSFFFDETFCDPEAELSRIEGAHAARSPLAYVGGDGAFKGVRWVIESFDPETLKTTPYGRATRIRVSVSLKEAPIPSMITFFSQIARAGAAALTPWAGGNPNLKI